MSDRIERIRQLLYEKSKIDVDPQDPLFLVVEILLENNRELEKETLELIQKRVTEILNTAEMELHMQTEAARETTRDMFKRLVGEIRQEIRQDAYKPTETSNKGEINPFIFYGLCVISTISMLINIMLLFSK